MYFQKPLQSASSISTKYNTEECDCVKFNSPSPFYQGLAIFKNITDQFVIRVVKIASVSAHYKYEIVHENSSEIKSQLHDINFFNFRKLERVLCSWAGHYPIVLTRHLLQGLYTNTWRVREK